MSLKQTSATSSGTSRLAPRTASIAPTATRLLTVKTALGVDARADDQLGVDGKACRLQRSLVALPAIARRRDVVALDDHPDPSVTEREQVLDEPLRPVRTVAEDGVGVDPADGAVDEHERDVEGGQPLQVLAGTVVDRRDQDPLDAMGEHLLDHLALHGEITAGVAEDHAVAGAPGDVLRAAHDQGEERVRHVGDDHRERSRPPGAETARQAAGHVAELADRVLDTPPRAGAHECAVVDHARDGHGRHAGAPRHISNRDSGSGHPRCYQYHRITSMSPRSGLTVRLTLCYR